MQKRKYADLISMTPNNHSQLSNLVGGNEPPPQQAQTRLSNVMAVYAASQIGGIGGALC